MIGGSVFTCAFILCGALQTQQTAAGSIGRWASGVGDLGFECKAAPVGKLLKRLSDQTGTSLKASGALSSEVLYVHARGVSLPELKSRIAKALAASWEKRSDAALRSIDPYTLAVVENEIVGNPGRMASYGVANLVGYAPGAEKLVTIRIELAAGVWKESTITVSDYDPNATPVPWDKLPEPYAKQIAESMERAKSAKSGAGRVVPPPRR